jgi:hypothetical protein
VQEFPERTLGGLAWHMTTTIFFQETHGRATMPIQTNHGQGARNCNGLINSFAHTHRTS